MFPAGAFRLTRNCRFCNLHRRLHLGGRVRALLVYPESRRGARRKNTYKVIMKRAIEKVVVLGAGTMGARIAAHVANAGVSCALLDMVPPELNTDDKKRGLTVASPEFRNRIVRAGLAAASKSRPAPFFTRGLEKRIITGNFDDD